jgi:hypothetical protein
MYVCRGIGVYAKLWILTGYVVTRGVKDTVTGVRKMKFLSNPNSKWYSTVMGHSFKTRQHVCIGHSDYLETSTNINDECVHSNKKRAQTTDPGARKHLLKTSTIMLRTRNNTYGITCNNTSGITEEDKRRDVRECEWWLWDLGPMGIWIGKDWEGSIRWVICLLGSLLVELLVIVIPYTAWSNRRVNSNVE